MGAKGQGAVWWEENESKVWRSQVLEYLVGPSKGIYLYPKVNT